MSLERRLSGEEDEETIEFVPKNRLQVDSPPSSEVLDMSCVIMHPDTADANDIFDGDVIKIKGRAKRLGRAYVRTLEDMPEGVVYMNEVLRHNLRLRTMDFCTVKTDSEVKLSAVRVALINTPAAEDAAEHVDFGAALLRYFDEFSLPGFDEVKGRPVTAGDVLGLTAMNRKLQFFVLDVVPADGESDWGIVQQGTRFVEERGVRERLTDIVLTPEPLPEEDDKLAGLNSTGYSDIGGLGKQLEQIREMIELPLRMPKLFATIGVKPPKGVLLSGPPGCGKTMIARAITNEVGAFYFLINGPDILAGNKGEENLKKAFEQCEAEAPAILFIDEIDAVAPNRDKVRSEALRRVVAALLTLMDGLKPMNHVMVLAATNRPNALDPALRRAGRFDSEIIIPVPDRDARREILDMMTVRKGMQLHLPPPRPAGEDGAGEEEGKEAEGGEGGGEDDGAWADPSEDYVDLDALADITHGYVGADLAALCTKAALMLVRNEGKEMLDVREGAQPPAEVLAALKVRHSHFLAAAKTITPSGMRDVAVSRPDVKFADIGGLEDVKKELREMIEFPVRHGALFAQAGIEPPRGALLYGPPGCGKTLMAKAIANECECNFISIKGPQLLSKWFGESEENVREIFDKARQSAPCVVFFDELDSIAIRRGSLRGDPGISDRVVNQLLTEMDGMGAKKNVFVIGATNFLENLDPAVLRTGRLDQFIYIGPPESEEGYLAVLSARLRKTPVDPAVDLRALARWALAMHLSPADVAGLCERAVQAAVSTRLSARADAVAAATAAGEEPPESDAASWAVQAEHFAGAAAETRPSISAESRARYEATRAENATQLTTSESAGVWTGRFTIPEGDPRAESQPYGTIDKAPVEHDAATEAMERAAERARESSRAPGAAGGSGSGPGGGPGRA